MPAIGRKTRGKGVEIARVQIADLDAIFTSELISSIHSEYKGSTKGGGIWAVVAGTDHAMFVEFGTGTVGQQNPYPGKLPDGVSWQYASGKLSIRFQMEDMDGLSGRQWRLVVYRGNAKPTIHVSDRK